MKTHGWISPILCMISLPIVWIAVLATWGFIDGLVAAGHVREFIRDHEDTITELRRNPHVHELTLKATGSVSETVAITVDVEDKATFDEVDSALQGIISLHFPPQWEITVRSNEDLDNDWGAAAHGIRLLGQFMNRMLIAAVFAVIVCATATWYFSRSDKRRTT